MKQIYHHWERWECIKMYLPDETPVQDLDLMLRGYADFLRDTPRFTKALNRVIAEWPIACEQFLSNESINRVAWLGQASMCIETGVPRKYRAGFCLLTEDEQQLANATAQSVLDQWLVDHA